MIAAMYADGYPSPDQWAAGVVLALCGLMALVGGLKAWAARRGGGRRG